MRKLVEFFISQSKVVNLIVIFITIAGGIVFYAGQKEGFPNVKLDQVWVTTAYFGASPREIEKLITDKIEDELEDIDGAEKITSRSIEGLSTVIFEIDSDYSDRSAEIINDIRSAVDAVDGLPDDALRPEVFEIKMDMLPVINVVLGGDVPEEVLRESADLIEEDLKKITGVGKLETRGYRAKEIWVEVEPVVLKNLNLDLSDIINAIRLRNINLPGGKIVLSDKEYLIRTLGQYKTLEDIKNTVIRGNDAGNLLRLGDVASVNWKYEKEERYQRIRSTKVISHEVNKKSSADIIKVCDAVKALVKKYRSQGMIPEGVELFVSDDMSFFVKRRLNVLSQNLMIGLLFIFLCLIIFLDFKTTFWTVVGIPIAFASAMLIASALGITLNLMSMFGFIIVIGMIVDDAIIVAENIFRHKEMGKPDFKAALDGTAEVMLPVTATVATTAAAFLPLMLIGGMMGKFLSIIPKVVTIAMGASLIECLFVLPAHVIHTRGKKKRQAAKNTDARQEDETQNVSSRGWFYKVQNSYSALLGKMLNRPVVSMISVVFISVFVAILFVKNIPSVFFPGTIDEFTIVLETPVENTLKQTEKTISLVEKRVRDLLGKDLKEAISSIGYYETQSGGPKIRSYVGSVNAVLTYRRSKNIKEILGSVDQTLQRLKASGKLVSYKVRQAKGGPPQEKPVSIKVWGHDLNRVIAASKESVRIVKGISNVMSVESSYELGKDEVILHVDDRRASKVKVSVNSTALAVRNAFEGGTATTANSLRNTDEDVDIIVKYDEKTSRKLEDLRHVKVKNRYGNLVPLDSFAEISFGKSVAVINHEDGRRVMYITGELKNPAHRKYTSTYIGSLLKKKIQNLRKKYPDVYIDVTAGQKENMKIVRDGLKAGFIALALIAVILVALFKSYLQPFMVMLVIPFAFVGVMAGILLHYGASFFVDLTLAQYAFSFMTIMGMVALTGVVVNDSLVLVSFVNYNRKNGLDKKEALLEAGKSRLRPIILTTITTLVGLIPMSYGIMGKEPFIQPMGIALIWGLAFATMVTLLILPCVYYLIDELAVKMYRIAGREYTLPGTLEN